MWVEPSRHLTQVAFGDGASSCAMPDDAKMLGQKGRAYSRSTNDQVLWRAWTSAIQRVSSETKSDFMSDAPFTVRVACIARL